MAQYTNDVASTAIRTETAFGIVAIFIAVYLLILALAITNYVFASIGLYKIAKRRALPHPFLAWIPIANLWIMGGIAQEYDERKGIKRNWKLALLLPMVISLVAMGAFLVIAVIMAILTAMVTADLLVVPMIILYVCYLAMLLSLSVYSVIYYISFFKIFESTVPEKALKYAILSLLLPLAHGICLYRARNRGYSVEVCESTDTPVTAVQEEQTVQEQAPQEQASQEQAVQDVNSDEE